jgi:chromosome segregation ATPase
MSLNPLRWIEWLINEHGSSTVIRERLAQAKDTIASLERKMVDTTAERDDYKSRLEKAQMEIDQLKQVNRELEEDRKLTPGKPGRGF